MLGVVGDSAAGKTTLARGLRNILGAERVTHVFADDYHRYDRDERRRLAITPLHPECNYLDILELHLERLHYGQPILKPVYDHSNGTLVRPAYVQPREFVILEGLLGFHSPVLRQFYDVKVYLDPAEDLRRVWKVSRDTRKRGYSASQVLRELDNRESDSQTFVRPQREDADIVVRFYPPEGTTLEEAGRNLNVRLILRPTIPHPDLSYLFNGVPEPASGIRLDLGRDGGRPADILEIEGRVTADHAARLEDTIWDHLPGLRRIPADQFGLYEEKGQTRQSAPLAITQLLLTYHLLREQSGLAQRPFARPVAALSRLHLPEGSSGASHTAREVGNPAAALAAARRRQSAGAAADTPRPE